MAVNLDEAEKQILGALLADFSDRKLGAEVLRKGYEGPKLSELTAVICTGEDITRVDFDIAFSDLEKKKFIRTGPYRAYDNKPGSGFVFMGAYSLREYAGLTELGYKTARQASNRPAKSQRIVNNVHISGGQFTNMQLAAGGAITQQMDHASDVHSDILSKLIGILERQGQVVSMEQRKDLITAIDEANDGNGKSVKTLLEKVFGPVWGSVQPVIWPVFGDLLKKSLGL